MCIGCSERPEMEPMQDSCCVDFLVVDSADLYADADTDFVIEGYEFIDFSGTLLSTDTPVRLSDLIVGHVALIDFWASWCRPCRQVIRDRMKEVYAEYEALGVVMVGVAVQDDTAALHSAIEELQMDWPQLYDRDGEAIDAYHLNTIPHLMLVSANGTVLAWDLHVAAIEAALDNALAIDDEVPTDSTNTPTEL